MKDIKAFEKIIDRNSSNILRQVRNTFEEKYNHVNIHGVSDKVIIEFWKKPHVLNTEDFNHKCYLLYDYLLSNDLTEIVL